MPINVPGLTLSKSAMRVSSWSITNARKTLSDNVENAIQGNSNRVCKVKDLGEKVEVSLTVNHVRLCSNIRFPAAQRKEVLNAMKQAIMDGQLDQKLTDNHKKAAAKRRMQRLASNT